MRVLDLFSGIGGFSLGLERAGMQTVAFCEIEPYCRTVLARHWPGVKIYEDIRTLTADALERDGIAVDAICGGFPCQDLSHAGKRAGLEGERSGLWGEYRRLIGELRPKFVIVENVPGLLSLGMGTVLGDLAALGYDAVWDCIPASALCAPHRRDRVWIVAHSKSERCREAGRNRPDEPPQWIAGRSENVADADAARSQRDGIPSGVHSQHGRAGGGGETLSNSISGRRPGPGLHEDASHPAQGCAGEAIEPVNGSGPGQRGAERGLGRVAHGVSDWLDEPAGIPRTIKGQENRAARLKALGNAVVPQVVELIGRAIMEAQRDCR